MEAYGAYHWVHTINNAVFVLLGLLYGGGDLGKSVSKASWRASTPTATGRQQAQSSGRCWGPRSSQGTG